MSFTIRETGQFVDKKPIFEITQSDGSKAKYIKDGDNYIEYDIDVYNVTMDNPDAKIKETKKQIVLLSKTEALGLHEVMIEGHENESQRIILMWSKSRGNWAKSVNRGFKFRASDTQKIFDGMRSIGWL